jgi:hypothetical protein
VRIFARFSARRETAALISSGLKDAIAFLVLLIVIFARSERLLERLSGKKA